MVSERVKQERFVFVDEMGANTSLFVLRAYCSVPRNRGKNTTLLATMSAEGMGPALALEGSTTATVFETYASGRCSPLHCERGKSW